MSNWVWFSDAVRAGITSYSLAAATGAYSLTGCQTGFTLIAERGAFVLTGDAASLLKGYDTGVPAVTPYALAGGAIGPFVRGFRIVAEDGEYKLTASHAVLSKTTVPVKDPTPYVEQAWEQPENEGSDLDCNIEWEAG